MDANQRRKLNHTSYISGNTARQYNTAPERDYDIYRRQPQVVTRPERNDDRIQKTRPGSQPRVGRGIDFLSMLILSAAMVVTLYVCFNYLQAQSDAIQKDKQITALETQLAELTDKNDALEISINKPLDLDEIYKIAVGELGMVYPNKNDVITYEGTNSGYVRQYDEIPSADN